MGYYQINKNILHTLNCKISTIAFMTLKSDIKLIFQKDSHCNDKLSKILEKNLRIFNKNKA